MENESLKMRFNGENEINLDTLSESLNSTLECLKIIADNVLSKEDYCKFVVKIIERGSFVIDISVIKEIAQTFAPIATGITAVLTGIFAIRKHLNGKLPKKIDKNSNIHTTIINAKGKTQIFNTTVVNIYVKGEDIEKNLSKLSSALAKDDARTTLVVEAKNLETIEYSKSDLENTSNIINISDFDKDKIETTDELTVKIKKLYFQGDAKWDFIILSTRQTISATIEDTEFLEKIQRCMIPLMSETKLKVLLKTIQKIDKEGNFIGKAQYFILKVTQINYPPEQLRIENI